MTSAVSVVADIGGSGTRFATIRGGVLTDAGREAVSSYPQFLALLRSRCAAPRSVAVSTARFVNSTTGQVRLSRAAPWAEGDLAGRLRRDLGCPVAVMNDGEAHALAMRRTNGVRFGALAVALGTSVGIGVLGVDRRVIRPCSGENWDLGDLRLHSRAPDPSLWWALGSNGLHEMESVMGTDAAARHFGYRLGAFFVQLVIGFQPRTIVLSGGITVARSTVFLPTVHSELASVPSHFVRPRILVSPFRQAGLVGTAVAVSELH
ncbi:ROK family protein [Mycolicibacterium llatzerense]|uniref:ROK family protein n=1 Tax=Mycolicibacterium llatzerense TaxID=280871 RepID=UPI0008DCD8F1|nr:ROK family protein [Mycolicibacterium llatzerense]